MKPPPISQDMIRLYDEYTHLTLDRRDFIDKLTRLAGSAAAAAVIAPLLAANPARAATVQPEDPRLKTETVTFPASKGAVTGYLAMPATAAGKLPGVIVVHENRGLNAHIEDVTRRLAVEGFVALAPDFLSLDGGTPADEDKARQMFSTLDGTKLRDEGMAAISYLKSDPRMNGKVGAIGFCWGGGVVNQLAVDSPDLGAVVAYYGAQPAAADVPRIKAKLLLHYAGLDDRINAGIKAFQEALDKNKIDYQIFIYDGVNHAFNNDTSAARYNKAAADQAWSRTVAFLRESLT